MSFTLFEKDKPGFGGRCDCMCPFDFSIEMPALLEPGVISVKLLQDVTDSEHSARILWEGQIDTREGSGTIVIGETECY